MRTDPDKAREMLNDEDISSYQRQQIESRIGQTNQPIFRN
jgi:hypothetical protein